MTPMQTGMSKFPVSRAPLSSDIAMSTHFILHAPHSVADLVSRRLSSERFWWSRDVEAHIEDDEVRLTGRVSTYYQKQVAQESLRGIQGVRRIYNELCVRH